MSDRTNTTLSAEGANDLLTLRANLRVALRNHQVVTIAGGNFEGAELAVLLYAVERTIETEGVAGP